MATEEWMGKMVKEMEKVAEKEIAKEETWKVEVAEKGIIKAGVMRKEVMVEEIGRAERVTKAGMEMVIVGSCEWPRRRTLRT
jgi:hypothetical protein